MTHSIEGETFVTARQAQVYALFVQHRSMSVVARLLGVSQITVREKLVQYQRNKLRDQGIDPPSLRSMLRGDVTPRFNVSREEAGGRPAKHRSIDVEPANIVNPSTSDTQIISPPSQGVRRFIVTGSTAGAPLHLGFLRNLQRYASALGAEVMVFSLGSTDGGARPHGKELAGLMKHHAVSIGDQVDIAGDIRIPRRIARALPDPKRANAVWTIIPHGAVQFETMTRIRAEGLRFQMTTGAVTAAATGDGEVGAVIVEIGCDGIAHCRHILAPAAGDGSFQDLGNRVTVGRIVTGCPVEALVFGDLHVEHIDDDVARSTWGIGAEHQDQSLVDELRPIRQVFHDICDFSARSHFDARDHHKRFAQQFTGANDVMAEMKRTAEFVSATRRSWSECLVVASNHDCMLLRWLRESDFREDPLNALYFLQLSLALHRRLAEGDTADGIFEHALRELAPDGLAGVRFLLDGESHRIAVSEVAIHGHKGPDGRTGGFQALERLGLRATIGHTHRPTSRDGLVSTGVCQTDLAYARGPLTAWAIGHVAIQFNGARQHLLFHGGKFHA